MIKFQKKQLTNTTKPFYKLIIKTTNKRSNEQD